jgi:hypothetical protein
MNNAIKETCTFIIAGISILINLFALRKIDENGLLFEQIFISGLISIFIFLVYNSVFRKKYNLKVMYIIILLACLFQFIFVNIDRSRSFYVISWVQNHNMYFINDQVTVLDGKIKSEESINKFGIESRIKEQLERNILFVNPNSKLELTTYGELIYDISEKLSKLYSLGGWQQNKI